MGIELLIWCLWLMEIEGSYQTLSASLVTPLSELGAERPSLYKGFHLYMTATQWPISRDTREPATSATLLTWLVDAAV